MFEHRQWLRFNRMRTVPGHIRSPFGALRDLSICALRFGDAGCVRATADLREFIDFTETKSPAWMSLRVRDEFLTDYRRTV
jgi:hypothetical protein